MPSIEQLILELEEIQKLKENIVKTQSFKMAEMLWKRETEVKKEIKQLKNTGEQ